MAPRRGRDFTTAGFKAARLSMLAAGSSLMVIASLGAARADSAGTPSVAPQLAQAEAGIGSEEIIVTARRKAENLQDVPETVDAVTSEQIQQYSILNFTDISKLEPGLQLIQSSNGFTTEANMRGVTYNENEVVPETVTTYLNDVPVDSNILFQGLYDIGQVEVLRGPTGTLRGLMSASGSITMTTRRPDMEQLGGYVNVTVGSLHDDNIQGAVNIPIVQDKFAIRIAGLRSTDDAGGVTSVESNVAPFDRTESGRITAKLAPTDNLSIVLTASRLTHQEESFSELYGPGSPGGIVPGATYAAPPAGYDGPPIAANQLLTVASTPTYVSQRYNFLSANIDWTFHGQKLSDITAFDTIGVEFGADQSSIYIPHWVGPPTYATATLSKTWNEEIRLSSVDPLFGHLDYTIGGFYQSAITRGGFNGLPGETGINYLAGAYGPPNAPIVAPPNETYTLSDAVQTPSNVYNYAAYGSLTYHFDSKTEITGGLRYSVQRPDYALFLTYDGPGTTVTALPFPCAVAHLAPSPYPGYCNVSFTEAPDTLISDKTYRSTTYNIELSHKFNEDLMAYFRTASNYRFPNIQYATAISGATVQALIPYIYPKAETSKSYEVGTKGDLFDKRVVFDVDFYHQVFNNTFYSTLPFYYLNQSILPGTPTTVSSTSVVTNAPAVVNGIEFHAVAKVTPNWTITPTVSWDNGHLSNAQIPCNPPSPTTPPTVAYFTSLGKSIYTCSSSTSTTTAPRWNLTVQSEYDHQINQAVDGFIRGLMYYYPSNPYSSSNGYVVPAYATFDLYLGLRRPDSAWEVNVYGKNIFNNQTITSEGLTQTPNTYYGYSGYFSITHTPRREFGLTLRYAFGSR